MRYRQRQKQRDMSVYRPLDPFLLQEVALLNYSERSASIICSDRLQLFMIDHAAFTHLCRDTFLKEIQQKINITR